MRLLRSPRNLPFCASVSSAQSFLFLLGFNEVVIFVAAAGILMQTMKSRFETAQGVSSNDDEDKPAAAQKTKEPDAPKKKAEETKEEATEEISEEEVEDESGSESDDEAEEVEEKPARKVPEQVQRQKSAEESSPLRVTTAKEPAAAQSPRVQISSKAEVRAIESEGEEEDDENDEDDDETMGKVTDSPFRDPVSVLFEKILEGFAFFFFLFFLSSIVPIHLTLQ